MSTGNTNKYVTIIKKYLESECEKDSALKAAYKPEEIQKCFSYITSQAKKEAVNGCAMIEDTKVFKWARDFYFDVLPGKKVNVENPEEPEEYDEEEIDEIAEEVKTTAQGKKKSKKTTVEENEAQCLFDFGE